MKTIAKLFDLLVITIFDYLPVAVRAIWRNRQMLLHLGISIYALHLFLSPVFAIEDYSTSLPDYPYEFGEILESQIGQYGRWEVLNMDKLAYAVAMAETGDCTKGAGRYNNCFGIMHWPNGVRTLRRYETKEDSYEHFKEIWSKHYKTFPTYSMAVKWTGNDNPKRWLEIVNYYYERTT